MKAFAAFSVALLLSIPLIHLAAGLRDEFQDRRQEEGAADAYSAESNGSGPGTNTNLNEQDQILTVASISPPPQNKPSPSPVPAFFITTKRSSPSSFKKLAPAATKKRRPPPPKKNRTKTPPPSKKARSPPPKKNRTKPPPPSKKARSPPPKINRTKNPPPPKKARSPPPPRFPIEVEQSPATVTSDGEYNPDPEEFYQTNPSPPPPPLTVDAPPPPARDLTCTMETMRRRMLSGKRLLIPGVSAAVRACTTPANITSATECCSACAAVQECFGWTWVTPMDCRSQGLSEPANACYMMEDYTGSYSPHPSEQGLTIYSGTVYWN